ncbi:tripartite tricarboxylate transporter substrate binding protein [Acidovorax sp. sif1233]|uniref:Bug family tripartite tricarboxylate transporter substrate binding protein n=1 Tax=unclassified Acidovorax TaxID=2684926 RepID=UPI001C49491E|nr:tripartite tricarboxylate transporter substrate binding protein [Acidovorax sp. sif1233]MBV7457248.1 tripartite tricarboxylate transporter substrate binding protein [Acidovorax sp. sif1233]
MKSRRNVLKTTAAVAASVFAPALSWAQAKWTAKKPIQLIVPGQAGGNSDIFARLISNAIGNALGQPIVVDNKPGASGTLASGILSKSPGDGHYLLAASSDTHTIYPHFFNNPNFRPEGHVPVAVLCFVPFALAVRKDLDVKDVGEFIALAKRQQVSFSTWGVGTTGQAAMMLFGRAAGTREMLHVPFTGSAPAIQALMAGQVDAMMGAIPLISSARAHLKPLAVMSRNRSPAMRDVPTMDEAGLVINETKEFWVGIMAPPGTPADAVHTIADEVRKAMALAAVKSRIEELGAIAEFVGPEDFKKVISHEFAQWARIAREAGVTRQNIG